MAASKFEICFLWQELPDYAARCIAYLAKSLEADFQVRVVATKPTIPIQGMERALGDRLTWIERNSNNNWSDLNLPVPKILFVAGYNYRPFQRLHREALRERSIAALMSDNNWVSDFRHAVVEPLRHRLFYRSKFDAIMVPGSSGARLARHLGYDSTQIFQGLYGADPTLFYSDRLLAEREKKLIFVGQLNERKAIDRLSHAFASCSNEMPEWTLEVYGSGPLAASLPRHQKINYHGFTQPSAIAAAMREARCFVLPSLQDNWGLVVHEAALSGCALMLSNRVGAVNDLACEHNAIIFEPRRISTVKASLIEISTWDDARWRAAQSTSLKFAKKFSPCQFAQSAARVVQKHGFEV